MKKFSLKTRADSHPSSKTKGLLAALVALIILAWLMPAVATTVSSVVLTPVHAVRAWVLTSDHSLAQYIQEKETLMARIAELEQVAASRSGTMQSVTRLLDENENLRAMLQYDDPDRMAARVLARPTQLPYDVIQIDRGRADGVVVDAPVFYGVDQVIGYVYHAAEHYSLVSLVSSPGQTATAYVLGPDVYTVAEGVGNGMVRVRLPQGVEVATGDVVILPAVSSGVFGELVEVVTTPTQPEQYGYVPLNVSLQSLRFVSVGATPLTPVTFEEASQRVDRVRDNLLAFEVPADIATSSIATATTTATTTASSTHE